MTTMTTDRYVRQSKRPFRGCITGLPGAGKTELALAPHPALGNIAYLALDDGAEYLEGIPAEFVTGGRVKVYKPGFDKAGVPTQNYSGDVVDFVKKPAPSINTWVIDTMNAYAEQAFCLAGNKDVRRDYGEAQATVTALYRELYQHQRHANILLLHHLDERTHQGYDKAGNEIQVFESHVPKTIGRALNTIWAGKFTFVVRAVCRPKALKDPKTGNIIRGHGYYLQFRPTDDMDVLKVRAANTEQVPAEVEITMTKGSSEPLLAAWDLLLRLTDSSFLAREALNPTAPSTPVAKATTEGETK